MLMLAGRECEVIDPTHPQPKLGGGEGLAPTFGRFNPGKLPSPTVEEAKWASGPVWMARKISPPSGLDPRTVQHVANRYTDYTIAATTA